MNDFAGITPFSCQEEVDCNKPIICHGRSMDKIPLMSGDTRLEGGVKNRLEGGVKNHLEDCAAKRRLIYRGGDELRGQVNENNTSSIEALASCSMVKCFTGHRLLRLMHHQRHKGSLVKSSRPTSLVPTRYAMTLMIQVATSAFVDQGLESIMILVKLSQMEQWREKYYGDLRKCKKIVIPIYSKEDGHWFTSVLNIELKTIVIWDSFTSPSVKKMQEKVLKHSQPTYTAHPTGISFNSFHVVHREDIPQQQSYYDSGLYTTMSMWAASSGAENYPESTNTHYPALLKSKSISTRVIERGINHTTQETVGNPSRSSPNVDFRNKSDWQKGWGLERKRHSNTAKHWY
ncbi:hypothetical protein TIFTF001_001207 [Ficus carica]|uniref:Ubiquitin-like protease family profile domain-containing protein n=1 Tax=Ficus carica TaxID=3494 RepID=A0AA87YYV7_FICCA|nr:hypothetical protein TIFTF001_001207 [Ficus carica]